MSGKHVEEESGEKVPLWIISFADMITLLLSFFVMLQTMAKAQDAALFGAGRDSFRRAIAGLGVPDLLFGKPDAPGLDYRKLKYPSEQADEEVPHNRVIDAEDELRRKTFDDLKKSLETQTENVSEIKLATEATPIRFNSSETSLDEAARQYLRDFLLNLKHSTDMRLKVQIVAFAAEQPQAKQQWLISTRRAAAVEVCLKELISVQGLGNVELESCGAGSGGRWAKQIGTDPQKCHVALVVTGRSNG